MIRWAEANPTEYQPNQTEDLFLTYGDDVQEGQWCYTPSRIVGKFFQIPFNESKVETYTVVWPCKYEYKN